MAPRYEVDLTLSSAKDLKNVNWRHGSLQPYAVVWVDPKDKSSTKLDKDGDTSPKWNEKLVISLPDPIDESILFIDIVHFGPSDDTKPLIGSTRLQLRDVVDDVGLGERARRTLQLKRPSGRPQGKVEVEVTVREPRYRAQDGYYAPPYGVPPRGSNDNYNPPMPPAYAPQQPPNYGNPYAPQLNPYYQAGPPPVGYPYAAAATSAPPYGQNVYGQAQAVGVKKNKYGVGTGLAVGAVAGVLGGMALSAGIDAVEDKIADDIADKIAEDYEYDDDF